LDPEHLFAKGEASVEKEGMVNAKEYGRRSKPRRAKSRPLAIRVNFEKAAFILAAMVLATVGLTLAFSQRPYVAPPLENLETVTVTVHPGDTLWGIASRFSDGNVDIRHVVRTISELNGLEGSIIRPGQGILVPVERPQVAGMRRPWR